MKAPNEKNIDSLDKKHPKTRLILPRSLQATCQDNINVHTVLQDLVSFYPFKDLANSYIS